MYKTDTPNFVLLVVSNHSSAYTVAKNSKTLKSAAIVSPLGSIPVSKMIGSHNA